MLHNIITRPSTPQFIGVKDLNQQVRHQLLTHFTEIYLKGEVAEIPKMEHANTLFFSIVEDQFKIKARIYHSRLRELNIRLVDGMHIMMRGKIDMYAPSGDYYFAIDYLELDGEGERLRQYEILKNKLRQEGLFDPRRKRPIPDYPRGIGLVTRINSAAYHDFIKTWRERNPQIPLYVVNVPVQGEQAAQQIIEACKEFWKYSQYISVVAFCRGGGSRNDLNVFDDEQLVRFVSQMPCPTVSGIGHESDFTLIDEVVDMRTHTPTECATRLIPSKKDYFRRIVDNMGQMQSLVQSAIRGKHNQVLSVNLDSSIEGLIRTKRQQLTLQGNEIARFEPSQQLSRLKALFKREEITLQTIDLISSRKMELERLKLSLDNGIEKYIKEQSNKLQNQAQSLHDRSPLMILQKGFAIVSLNHHIIKDATQLSVGDEVEMRFEKQIVKATISEPPVHLNKS
jgi:exodeoxyribonuclease VII large subunit